MLVFVCPISGGFFPSQVAIYKHMCNYGVIPEVALSSSGGTIATYVAIASDFNPFKIMLVCEDITPSTLMTNWLPKPLPSEVFGFFIGSIFNSSSEGPKLLEKYINVINLEKVEVWTGTYNQSKSKTRLFCNKSEGKTIINPDIFDYTVYQMMEPGYGDLDIEKISKFVMASASIPSLVAPQIIDNDKYVDGGINYASPLSPMNNMFDENINCIYINSFNIEEDTSLNQEVNCLRKTRWAIDGLTSGTVINDRNLGISILEKISIKKNIPIKMEEYKLDDTFKSRLSGYKSDYFIELYPLKSAKLNMINFTSEQLRTMINEQYKMIYVRAWYL